MEENLKVGSYTRNYKPSKLAEELAEVYELSPGWLSARPSWQVPCPAESSRCWPLPGHSVSDPKLLMLDEPSLGLAPVIIETIVEKVKEINELGTTILLIEQNAELALPFRIWPTYSVWAR